MKLSRRTFVAAAAAASAVRAGAAATGEKRMYGLIGKMRAKPGQREALVKILLEGTGGMPGNLDYIIARDAADADAIWITETWDSEASHKASLQLPAVRAAIAKGRPLIAGFDSSTVTEPVGRPGSRAC